MVTAAIWFLVVIVAVTVLFLGWVYFNRYSELKELEKKQRQLSSQCREQQKEFRSRLQELQSAGIINAQQKQPIVMLINNYFVFQTINDVNYSHFCELLNSLSSTIDKTIAAPSELNAQLSEPYAFMAQKLPLAPASYNADFYLTTAPKHAEQLQTSIDQIIAQEWDGTAMNSSEEEEEETVEALEGNEAKAEPSIIDNTATIRALVHDDTDFTREALEIHNRKVKSKQR